MRVRPVQGHLAHREQGRAECGRPESAARPLHRLRDGPPAVPAQRHRCPGPDAPVVPPEDADHLQRGRAAARPACRDGRDPHRGDPPAAGHGSVTLDGAVAGDVRGRLREGGRHVAGATFRGHGTHSGGAGRSGRSRHAATVTGSVDHGVMTWTSRPMRATMAS